MMDDLTSLFGRLSAESLAEVRRFARSLLRKQSRSKARRLRMGWAGGLREFRDEFTSLDLQRKAMEWWGD